MGYVEDLRKLVGQRPLLFVGAVVLIRDDEGRLLFQQRRHPYGRWGFPGGLMELGESVEEAARREVFEETGLSVGELHLIGVFSGEDHYTVAANGDPYYVVVIAYESAEYEGTPVAEPSESLDCRFVDPHRFDCDMVRTHRQILQYYLQKRS